MKLYLVLALAAAASAKPRQATPQNQWVTDAPHAKDATPQNQWVTEGPSEADLRSLRIPEDNHFEYTNPEMTDDGEMLYESDIVLTAEQRDNRQASTNLWTSPVNFVITSSSAADRDAIIAGINHWRENTCIEFNEVAEGTSGPHLQFVKSTGCWSYVGVINNVGQQISIGSGCTGLGTVAHEIGHAMGLYHQQSRHDRDTYVQINFENIQSGKEGNFNKRSTPNNYSVPYDLTSMMHYGDTYFTSNGQKTIQVLEVVYEGLIGSRSGMSHRDKQIANAMYACANSCSSPPDCQNGGFVDKNCACVCPPNTSGTTCETLNGPYYGALDCGDTSMSQPGTITSPNYPNNFPKNVDCFWIITAAPGQQVKVTVTDMKMLYRSNGQCYWDYLSLRYTGDMYNDDQKACDEELTGQSYTSTGNSMLIKFHSGNYGWYRGFTANVEFIGEVVTTTSTAATTAASTAAPPGGNCGGARRQP